MGTVLAILSVSAFADPKVEMTNPRYVEKQKKVDEQIKKDPRYRLSTNSTSTVSVSTTTGSVTTTTKKAR